MPQADKTPGPDKTLIQKNWADNVMPQSFLRWREDEAQVLYDLTYQENIVDFCCGDAKILKTIKHQVRSYLGVDYDETSIVSAQKEAAGFNNIMFSPPVDYKAFIDHHLLDYLTDGQTYFGLSIGNAIGPLNKPSVFHVLNKASKMDKFFLSTLKKGNLDLRIEYYNNIGDSYDIDYDNEIIYSKTWGQSFAFSTDEFDDFAHELSKLGFKTVGYYDFGRLAHAILFERVTSAPHE